MNVSTVYAQMTHSSEDVIGGSHPGGSQGLLPHRNNDSPL